MSCFGISPGDIIRGLEACRWLYSHCFVHANSADTKYREFGRQIQGLGRTLALLQQQQAEQQGSFAYSADPTQHAPHTNPFRDFVREVGDYESTLEECKTLLSNKREFETDRAGFIANIKWGASTQSKVDALLARIRHHNDRINLFLEPIRMDQMGDVKAGLHLLLNPIQELDAKRIPWQIASRFAAALDAELAARRTVLDRLPPMDKLSALYRHWHGGTIQCPEGVAQNPEQYLNLLKSAWLVLRLKESASFQTQNMGLKYPLRILEVQRGISAQFARPDLSAHEDQWLLSLAPAAFAILDEETAESSDKPVDDYAFEERLLEIPLVDLPGLASHRLLVNRISPDSLRLIREKIRQGTNATSLPSETISIYQDLLIPWYVTQPANSGSAPSLEVRKGNGTSGTAFDFRKLSDLFKVQQAITGYQVVSDIRKISYTMNTIKLGMMGVEIATHRINGKGRIQIWLYSPLQAKNEEPDTRRPLNAGTVSAWSHEASAMSGSTNSVMTSIMRGFDQSIFDSSFAATVGPDGDGAICIAGELHVPLIVVPTMTEGLHAFLAMELEHGLVLNKSKCKCKTAEDQCDIAVVESKESQFTIRKFAAQQPQKWNVAVFSRPSQYGEQDRHPDFKNLEKIKCKYLSLQFASIADRKLFCKNFKRASEVRDTEAARVEEFFTRARWLSEHPAEAATSPVKSPLTSPRTSMVGVSSFKAPASRSARSSTGSSAQSANSTTSQNTIKAPPLPVRRRPPINGQMERRAFEVADPSPEILAGIIPEMEGSSGRVFANESANENGVLLE